LLLLVVQLERVALDRETPLLPEVAKAEDGLES
jgi:hypothetical protein